MSVETTELPQGEDLDRFDLLAAEEEEATASPDLGGIAGGGLAALKAFTDIPRPHRRSLGHINRLLTTVAVTSLVLGSCAPPQASSSPSPMEQPGITQPVETTVAQETGAMISQTQEGRAFYGALTAHGVDASACSPDVLGNLVIEKDLSLDIVNSLTTITTDALANTPEPDNLKAMVCNVVDRPNGAQTVEFYFTSDEDHTGDGNPDIFIPSQAKVLLPGELVDGVPQVVEPAIEGQSPAGSSVSAPDWRPAGGEIPEEIRGLMTVEEQSIRYSLAEQNINPDRVLIHPVSRGSGNDFRMGNGVTNVDQTIAFYPKFDDTTDGYAWRPDLRLMDRPWHWQTISLPEGVNGKIEVVFDPDSEAPQYVALSADESQMIGWFNNITGQWLTGDGKELMPVPTSTPEPSPTPTEMPVERMIVQGKEVRYGILTDQEVIDVLNATRSDVPLHNAIFVSGIALTNIVAEDEEIRLGVRIPTDNNGSVELSVVFGPDDSSFWGTPCNAAAFDNFDITHPISPLKFQEGGVRDLTLVGHQLMLRISLETTTRTPPAACKEGWSELFRLVDGFSKDILAQALFQAAKDGGVIDLGRAPRATVIYSSSTK